MKSVNLLPHWYSLEQKQRRNLRVHVGVMVAIGLAMAGWNFIGHQRIVKLRSQRDHLTAQLEQVGDPDLALRKQQAELARLENLQLAYRELGNTVPMSSVIQQIQNDMTPGMAINHINIDVHSEPVKGSGFVGDVKHPPRYHDVAHLEVVGVAPNDVQIAQLIGKMSSNSLFGDVSLNYTKTEILNNYMIRKFEIRMEMDLEPLATEDPDESPKAVATGGPDHAG